LTTADIFESSGLKPAFLLKWSVNEQILEQAINEVMIVHMINGILVFICNLRRLERVFCCCSGCVTMKDYKEGYLMVWANYMSPCNSIAGLYFEDTCDVISVTMAMHKVHKNVH